MKRLLPYIGVVNVATPVSGVLAWVWLADWRWAVTGLAAMVVTTSVGYIADRTATR
jgi:ABC-type sugar transport system permease subunit